jgi:nucleoside-diphosphate-sugar epimerase
MKLLVLGGTRFVGRAVVTDALSRGWEVTVLHRGVTGRPPAGVEVLHADRTDEAAFSVATRSRRWDAVVDTWSGAPSVATRNAALLARQVDRYAYVSSQSVYEPVTHVDERSPLVDGDPHADGDVDYAALKRGAELGIVASFPDAVLARAGLILGPHEDVGRLPWWLTRIAAGGRVVAPGRPRRALQYVDARDLAAWLLSSLEDGVSGAVDLASRSGHTTMAGLLDACVRATGSAAQLVWIAQDELEAAGAQPWIHLPCWVPEGGEFAGFLEADTSRARATGLRCRPVDETVLDTWEWLRADGPPAQRAGIPRHGLPAHIEERLLAAHRHDR